jgi:hypothetical protein
VSGVEVTLRADHVGRRAHDRIARHALPAELGLMLRTPVCSRRIVPEAPSEAKVVGTAASRRARGHRPGEW